jgi:hypothetical protein
MSFTSCYVLRPAAVDPFPSQRQNDYQPPAILEEGLEEYHVERITGERMVRRSRGYRKQYRVKWTGCAHETWTDAELLEDVAALDDWERTQAGYCVITYAITAADKRGSNVTGGTRGDMLRLSATLGVIFLTQHIKVAALPRVSCFPSFRFFP